MQSPDCCGKHVAILLPKEKKGLIDIIEKKNEQLEAQDRSHRVTNTEQLQVNAMSYTESDYKQFEKKELQEKEPDSFYGYLEEGVYGEFRHVPEPSPNKNKIGFIFGSKRYEFTRCPAPVESQEEMNTILSDLQALENSLLESGFVTFRNAKGDIISIKGVLTHIVRMITRLTP